MFASSVHKKHNKMRLKDTMPRHLVLFLLHTFPVDQQDGGFQMVAMYKGKYSIGNNLP
jgi:hypothetical protein